VPIIVELREDTRRYIQRHGLSKRWEKAKTLFESDPSHPSLNTELLEPKHRLIYSFRIDRKYRAFSFACLTTRLKSLPLLSITVNNRGIFP